MASGSQLSIRRTRCSARCHASICGNWGNQLTKISVNPENTGLIETGEAFKQASKFLEDGYNNENQE